MSRKWTREQALAICDKRGTLLLSAAAGSGKTAVLVERAVRLMTRRKNPVPADRLLIATFSNEAAREMKQRIDARISQLLQDAPDSVLLRRQQILLQKADISTISSFCAKLVREHFQELELPSDFRIASEGELADLKNETIEAVLEEQYQSGNPDFPALVEFICGRDDRRLIEVVFQIYEFIRSLPFEFRWLDQQLEAYQKEEQVLESDWGKILGQYAEDALRYARGLLLDAVKLMQGEEKLCASYESGFVAGAAGIDDHLRILKQGEWDPFYYAVRDFKMPKIGQARGYTGHPVKERVAAMRKLAETQIKGLAAKLASSEAELQADKAVLYPRIRALFETVKLFHLRYGAAKRERGVTDFSDLEHFALRLLVEETPEGCRRTALAEQMAAGYDYLLIDEYQDTNEVQDFLFAALSGDGRNLFMVGDVKQSIYRFRQAMPEIFLQKRQDYARYDRRHYPATLVLGKNFRSRKQVTDTVNYLFSQLMSPELGEIDYNADETLILGAVYDEYDAASELHVVDLAGEKYPEDDTLYEARYIAKRIEQMLDDGYLVQGKEGLRPCKPSDFCILLRSQKGKTSVYADQLSQLGIRTWADTAGDFLSSREVSVILSLLKVIDNPLGDIPLLAVMLSPLFSFTADDLAELRIRSPRGSLYMAVVNAAREGDEKCGEFLDKITEYRRFAAVLQVNRLIQYILDDTDYLDLLQVMREPAQKRANLRLLCSYAVQYSQAGYLGVSGFLRFIDRLEEKGVDMKSASKASDGENAVRIMTIHGSKGLEFPICIVADCGKLFNRTDLYRNGLLNGRIGFAMKIREPERLKEYSNIPYEAVRLENERLMLSEELRVLYVALTRAKEKLILTMTSKNLRQEVLKLLPVLGRERKLPSYTVRSANSFGQWILMALLRNPDMIGLYRLAEENMSVSIPCESRIGLTITAPLEEELRPRLGERSFEALPDEEIKERLDEQIRYRYPYEEETRLPSKLSVTQITTLKEEQGRVRLAKPDFLQADGLSGAERGTAVHTFLQFADFRRCVNDLPGELARMEAQRFLTPEQCAAIEPEKLAAFFRSGICQKILTAERVYREYKFMYELPARELYDDILSGEHILVQGIADCVIEEPDGLIIVDYKTDRVSSPAELAGRYGSQLALYRRAIGTQFGKPVKSCVIYSVELEREIEV